MFFFHHQIELLSWPARSPDLLPIENLWSMVAQRLTQITPPVATPDQLWQLGEAACNTSIYANPRLKRSQSYTIFKYRFFFLIAETQVEFVPAPDGINNMIEEVVDLARQTNIEVVRDNVQELLFYYNQELTMDELIELHEQKQELLLMHHFTDSLS
ncbi:transposable element Tcb1 transposase [Trichonephila clavipes]|nr:transposable element Tcb1 transposase [Trichonephila clavipes]